MIFDEGREDDVEGAVGGQTLAIGGSVVVDDDFFDGSPTQQLLAVLRRRQIGQRGLAHLQPFPVPPIRTVQIDRTSHVTVPTIITLITIRPFSELLTQLFYSIFIDFVLFLISNLIIIKLIQ